MTLEEKKAYQKEYHKHYYLLNKERIDRILLINYHLKKEKKATCGRKQTIDLSVIPPIKYPLRGLPLTNTQTSYETPECLS